ncbi:MAG: ester cyclase [Anaerolineae bacterium]|nr:ester cyclase [Anaerolineae bacterium]
MSEENKAIVHRYVEQVWNARKLDLFEQFVAEDIVHHGAPEVTDRESMKKTAAMILDAFPDWQETIDDEIAEGDRVVQRQTYSGTHHGEFLGIPATGKHAVWSGIWVFRLAGGKIVELWGQVDQLSMMQQLGLMPSPGQGGD